MTPNIDQPAKDGEAQEQLLRELDLRAVAGDGAGCKRPLSQRRDLVVQKFNGLQTTFPKLLQNAGYQTSDRRQVASDQRADGVWISGVLPGRGFTTILNSSRRRARHGSPATPLRSSPTSPRITGKAQRDLAKPFMLMIHHKAPHRNWQPAPQYAHWLEDVKIPEPPNLFDDYSGRTPSASKQEMEIGRHMTLKSGLRDRSSWSSRSWGLPV